MEHTNKDRESPGEDQEGAGEGLDPVIRFVLTPSEQIHACLNLPNLCLQPGVDSQDSYKVVMEWIHSTVRSLPQYEDEHNRVIPAYAHQNNPPAGIRRAMQTSHPLIFQKATPALVGALSAAFAITAWEADCRRNGISLGAIVVAARPSAPSSFVTCSLFVVGPFLAVGGM